MKRFIKTVSIIVALVCFSFGFSCGETASTPTEIKNIVLIIGDGMGIEHITAGELMEDTDYPFTKWDFVSVNTDSVNGDGKGPVLTDSAAGGTALATGHLTVNGYVGKDHAGNDVKTILDYASEKNKATGVVTTDNLFGATPGSFSAHSLNRGYTDEIVRTQILSGVNLLCGEIDGACTSQKEFIESNGYAYCDNYAKIEETLSAKKAYWQFDMATDANDYSPLATGKVKLESVTEHVLDFLSADPDGFVVMIEQGHIDKHSHSNNFDGMQESVNSLNRTVEAVKKWIGDRKDTAILITADHETGGLSVGLDDVYPNKTKSEQKGKFVYYNWKTGDHTNAKVGLFTYGITVDYSAFDYYGSDHLIKNVNVFETMLGVLNSPTKYSAFTA